MTEHYDDTDDLAERTLSNRQVLGFIGAFWLRRPVLFWTSVVLTLVAIGFDLALPWAAGRLMDIVAAGPDQADLAWRAWAIFIGVFLAFTVGFEPMESDSAPPIRESSATDLRLAGRT